MGKLPYHECPSFIRCACNNCPLDPEASIVSGKEHFGLKGEEKCRAYKPTRKKIGLKYPEVLKYQGLTAREYTGKRLSKGIYLPSQEKRDELVDE